MNIDILSPSDNARKSSLHTHTHLHTPCFPNDAAFHVDYDVRTPHNRTGLERGGVSQSAHGRW